MAKKAKLEPQEVVKKTMATKTVYHYIDTQNGIDVKSREVFKKKKCVVHFPFDTRDGSPKYDIIHKIVFEDVKIPAGFLKTPTRGYGFTRDLELTPNYVPHLIIELPMFLTLQSGRRSVAEPGGLQFAAKAAGVI